MAGACTPSVPQAGRLARSVWGAGFLGALSLSLSLLLGVFCAAVRASASMAALACPQADYQVEVAAQRVSDDVVGIAWLAPVGRYMCRLRVQLRFAAQPANDRFSNPRGALAGVTGNPATARIDAVLRPGSVVVRAWRWSNWCGAQGRDALFAGAGSFRNWWTPTVAPPSCRSPGTPSTLTATAPRLPACRPEGYRIETDGGQGYRQHTLGHLAIVRRGTSPCLLHTQLTFELESQTAAGWSALGSVHGNPDTFRVAAVLGPRNPLQLFWAWANWCGPGGNFRWFASDPDHRVAAAVSHVPVCGAPGSASPLTPFYNPPVPVRPRLVARAAALSSKRVASLLAQERHVIGF